MATIPTSPGTFDTNSVPTVSELNSVASLASFATQVPVVISLKKSGSQSYSSGNVGVTWQTVEVDSDGMFSSSNSSRVTCVTQGVYKFMVTIAAEIVSASANEVYTVFLQQTTGSNNPHYSSGSAVNLGQEVTLSSLNTSDYVSVNLSAIARMFVGDYVQVAFNCTVATTIVPAWMNTGNTDIAGYGDGASCLYGYWIGEAS